MAVYLVTWDLNKEGRAYAETSAKLHARLDTLTTIKDVDLDSVRFVSTEKSAQELYNYIEQGVLDANDKIVVSRMRSGEYHGFLAKDVWPWIAERL